MLRWRIYYGDGGTYSNEDGGPEAAPARNVQIIVQADEMVGRYYQSCSDHYVWEYERERWRGCDAFGLFDYLLDPGPRKVIFGRTIDNDEYADLLRRVDEEGGFQHKSSHLPRERLTP